MTISEWLFTPAARQIPNREVSVACGVLGVPADDRLLFWRWADDLSNPKTLDELHAYVDVMIADRCRRPGGDLVSRLIQIQVDGQDLTVDDIRAFVASLVASAGER